MARDGTKGLSVDLPDELHKQFMAYCKELDIKSSEIIRRHIRSLLAKAAKKR